MIQWQKELLNSTKMVQISQSIFLVTRTAPFLQFSTSKALSKDAGLSWPVAPLHGGNIWEWTIKWIENYWVDGDMGSRERGHGKAPLKQDMRGNRETQILCAESLSPPSLSVHRMYREWDETRSTDKVILCRFLSTGPGSGLNTMNNDNKNYSLFCQPVW